MNTHPVLAERLVADRRRELLARADSWRLADVARRARRAARRLRRLSPPATAHSPSPVSGPTAIDHEAPAARPVSIADALDLAGRALDGYPVGVLDGDGRTRLRRFVNAVLAAVSERGIDPALTPLRRDDPSIVGLRSLGHLAVRTAGHHLPLTVAESTLLATHLAALRRSLGIDRTPPAFPPRAGDGPGTTWRVADPVGARAA